MNSTQETTERPARKRSPTFVVALCACLLVGGYLSLRRTSTSKDFFVSEADRARNRAILTGDGDDSGAATPTEAEKPAEGLVSTSPQRATHAKPPPAPKDVASSGSDPFAPACLTATPAAVGTAFPCATRITKFNSNDFWEWTPAETERKERLLEPFLTQCTGIDPNGPTPTERPTTHVQIVGCTGASGMWNRCWIVPMMRDPSTNASVPSCKAGDHFDVMVQNDVAKVALDRILDLDNGIHEMQFYIRKRGRYNIVVDKVMMHQTMPKGFNGLRLTLKKDSVIGHVTTSKFSSNLRTVTVPASPAWPKNAESFEGSYELGVDVVPVPDRCDEVYDPDRFRFGAWYKVARCDNIHCTGTLEDRPWLEGWLWTSDVCIMRMHSTKELHQLMLETWLVGWGGSTMKQPLSNFVEYYMHRPIFRMFMNNLDAYKRSKKRPGFFAYRQWDTRPLNSTRVSMQWGGCPNIVAGPSGCTTAVGLGSWGYKILSLVGSPPPADPPYATPSFPTALLLDLTVWRYPKTDDVEYFRGVDDLMKQIDRLVNATKRRRPMVVWHTTPVGANSDRGVRPIDAPISLLTTVRNYNWYNEDHMARYRNRVVMISRHTMTMPLHFGNDFVHFGLHYGASEGMCNTGHERKGYEFANCVCKTWGDDAVIVAWMNAYAEYKRNGLQGATDVVGA